MTHYLWALVPIGCGPGELAENPTFQALRPSADTSRLHWRGGAKSGTKRIHGYPMCRAPRDESAHPDEDQELVASFSTGIHGTNSWSSSGCADSSRGALH